MARHNIIAHSNQMHQIPGVADAVVDRIREDAQQSLEHTMQRHVDEYKERLSRHRERETLGLSSLSSLLQNDRAAQKARQLFREEVQNIRTPPFRDHASGRRDITTGGDILRPGGHVIMDGKIPIIGMDTVLDVLGAPYEPWTTKAGGDHQHHEVFAEPDGRFGYISIVGNEGGWATAAAGIWVQFVPKSGVSFAQVRPYCPYEWAYLEISDIATAHSNGNFGILVLSWDLSGNDQRTEKDYRYSVWNDGTGWTETHTNPSSWPNTDTDVAFYPNQSPYFDAHTDRIYKAAIWCFGGCDGAGSGFPASVAAALVFAHVPFVVIGQQ